MFTTNRYPQIQQAANTLGVPFEDLKRFVRSYQTQNIPSGTIEITARQLAQEYNTNQVRAETQYYGKILKITGQVSRIFNIGNDYILDLVKLKNPPPLAVVVDSELILIIVYLYIFQGLKQVKLPISILAK